MKSLIVLGITSNKTQQPYLIRLPPSKIEDGRLNSPSQVMCRRISTIPLAQARKIAKVSPDFYNHILAEAHKLVLQHIVPKLERDDNG